MNKQLHEQTIIIMQAQPRIYASKKIRGKPKSVNNSFTSKRL